jgi:hypothetical protein
MTILTHIRPHLDDLCGIWLLSKYSPEHKDADFAYVPSSKSVEWLKMHPGAVGVGTGRGRFDEHKGDLNECAASLVWAAVREHVVDESEKMAIDRMVSWVLQVDTGMTAMMPYRQFSLPAVFLGVYKHFDGNDEKLRELAFTILEGLLLMEKNVVQLEKEWGDRHVFTSRFGPAVAFVASADGAEDFAYSQGFDLVVTVNPSRTYFNIRAKAGTLADLTPVHDALLKKDPEADWFFHHSKKMLICGGYLAPDARLSQLSMEQLIELVK